MYSGAFKGFTDFKKAELRYLNWRERSFLPDLPNSIRRVHDAHVLEDCGGPVNRTYGNFYIDCKRIVPPRYHVVEDVYDPNAFFCEVSHFPKHRPKDLGLHHPNNLWRFTDVNELHLPDVINVDVQIHAHHGEMTEIRRAADGKAYVLNTPVKHASLRGADVKTINLEFMNNDKSLFHLSALPVDYDCGHIRRN